MKEKDLAVENKMAPNIIDQKRKLHNFKIKQEFEYLIFYSELIIRKSKDDLVN